MKKWGTRILHKCCYLGNLHTHGSDFFLTCHLSPRSFSLKKSYMGWNYHRCVCCPTRAGHRLWVRQPTARTQSKGTLAYHNKAVRKKKTQKRRTQTSPCPSFHYWWIHWGFHGFVTIYQSTVLSMCQQKCVPSLQGMMPTTMPEEESLVFSI